MRHDRLVDISDVLRDQETLFRALDCVRGVGCDRTGKSEGSGENFSRGGNDVDAGRWRRVGGRRSRVERVSDMCGWHFGFQFELRSLGWVGGVWGWNVIRGNSMYWKGLRRIRTEESTEREVVVRLIRHPALRHRLAKIRMIITAMRSAKRARR